MAISSPAAGFGTAERTAATRLVEAALDEDLAGIGDLTTRLLIPPDAEGTVGLVARQRGTLAGLPILPLVFEAIDTRVRIDRLLDDGARLVPGARIATLRGPTASLLTGERTALNFLTHLSGIATLTRQFVDAAAGTSALILDTRKTLPGWRVLQKYAVRCGGGSNHRMGLYDGVLIKDNHLAAWTARGVASRTGGDADTANSAAATGPLAQAVLAARRGAPQNIPIEVEVDSLSQLEEVLAAGPEIVLLDNFSPDQMRAAVLRRNELSPDTRLEASGRVSLETVADIAATGVDRISIGMLTHSAPALDLAFDWDAAT